MEAPLRTCPECGLAEPTRFPRCRVCGAPFEAVVERVPWRRRPRVVVALVLGVAALGVGTVLALQRAADEREKDRVAQARAVAAERVRLRRVQAPHRGAAVALRPASGASRPERLAARAALVDAVEAAITTDARARVQTGELDGPIARTECGPILKDPRAVPDDRILTRSVGRYDCVAIRREIRNAQGERVADLGHAFVAALDFRGFTFVWCRNVPAQGERGQSLAKERLDRACLAARGRALGTGYVRERD